jgi:hypothetical protein
MKLCLFNAGTLQLAANDFTVSGASAISGTIADNSPTGTNIFKGLVTINSGGYLGFFCRQSGC